MFKLLQAEKMAKTINRLSEPKSSVHSHNNDDLADVVDKSRSPKGFMIAQKYYNKNMATMKAATHFITEY